MDANPVTTVSVFFLAYIWWLYMFKLSWFTPESHPCFAPGAIWVAILPSAIR